MPLWRHAAQGTWFSVLKETGESALTEIMENPSLIAGGAFALGLLFGWLIRGGFRSAEARTEAAKAPAVNGDLAKIAEAEPGDKLALILAELQKARDYVETAEDTDAAMTDELEKLDQAVKRANGRLKLILKTAERAKDAE